MAHRLPHASHAEAVVTRLPLNFDDDDALRWRERFRRHLAEGHKLHVIDVDGVDLPSTTMLGFIIHVLRMVRERGGAVGLVATREKALHTLGVTGLNRVFRVGRTVPEAIALITSGSAVPQSNKAR
jgi:anti-anti-sigma factor